MTTSTRTGDERRLATRTGLLLAALAGLSIGVVVMSRFASCMNW